MPEVKVAIVIANYNTSHFVCDAIKSALEQDYPAKGLFIVDDASTDDSIQKIEDFFRKKYYNDDGTKDLYVCIYPKEDNEYYVRSEIVCGNCPVHLFCLKKNVGRGQVRNFPIAYALNNGYHLVQILDSDDMMYPNKVSELAKVMLEDPEHIGITYADYIILNVETGTTTYESKPAFEYLKLMGGQSMIHSGALINGAALAKVGLYEGSLQVTEDFQLFRRICQSFIAIGIAKPLTIVRSHSGDSTQNVSKEIWNRDFQRTMSGI